MKRAVVALSPLLVAAGLPLLTAAPAAAATPVAGQATYVPLEPVRLLDTREGLGRVGPGGTLDVVVADGLRVPADATAVVLNVTATAATGPTDVRAYPTPVTFEAPPTVSNLNLGVGQTVANLVHVKVGQAGAVRLRNESGQVHLLADLSGYYREAPDGATYVPADPRRLLDTRTTRTPLAAGEVRTLRVTGDGAAPEGAVAVALNVTAVNGTRQTDVRVWPTRSGPPPTVSNLNPPPGRPTAAAAVVAVGADGTVSLRSSAGTVDLAVDLAGWYVAGDSGSAFRPVAPVRLLDSRVETPLPGYPAGTPGTAPFRLGPGGTYALQVAGRDAVPAQATAVVLNVTGVRPTATSDVRVFPATGGGAPEASNLNVVRGQTSANAVVVRVGRDGRVVLRNGSGELDLVVDLAGWFLPTGDGWDVSWPQCTTRGATTSNLPTGGAFAVVGLTRSNPFTDNECFAAQWAWASSLPGEPSVYVNVDAPGVRDRSRPGQLVWEEVCGTGTATSACGQQYGQRIAAYVLERLPTTPSGGRPMVWLDVEGPYANGPYWQRSTTDPNDPLVQANPNAVAVNRAVISGVVGTLRTAGYRVGVYSDRGTVEGTSNDWTAITGDWSLPHLQNWVFRSTDADPRTVCGPANSFSSGPVVMAQVQPATNPGVAYDVNGLC